MHCLTSAESLILSATRSLIAYKVRICTAESCRAYSLVSIDHDVMLCSLLDGVEIMIVHPLSVMMLALRQYVSHISALHCIISVLVHKIICSLHVALIIA